MQVLTNPNLQYIEDICDSQVMTLNETILNVFRNYVPNKYITIDDKDPVWMNETIKLKIKNRDKLYKQYAENGRFESDFMIIETLITEINDLITSTKDQLKIK